MKKIITNAYLMGAAVMALWTAIGGLFSVQIDKPIEFFLGSIFCAIFLGIGYYVAEFFLYKPEPIARTEWYLIASAANDSGWAILQDGHLHQVLQMLAFHSRSFNATRTPLGHMFVAAKPAEMWVVCHKDDMQSAVAHIKAWEAHLATQAENE